MAMKRHKDCPQSKTLTLEEIKATYGDLIARVFAKRSEKRYIIHLNGDESSALPHSSSDVSMLWAGSLSNNQGSSFDMQLMYAANPAHDSSISTLDFQQWNEGACFFMIPEIFTNNITEYFVKYIRGSASMIPVALHFPKPEDRVSMDAYCMRMSNNKQHSFGVIHSKNNMYNLKGSSELVRTILVCYMKDNDEITAFIPRDGLLFIKHLSMIMKDRNNTTGLTSSMSSQIGQEIGL